MSYQIHSVLTLYPTDTGLTIVAQPLTIAGVATGDPLIATELPVSPVAGARYVVSGDVPDDARFIRWQTSDETTVYGEEAISPPLSIPDHSAALQGLSDAADAILEAVEGIDAGEGEDLDDIRADLDAILGAVSGGSVTYSGPLSPDGGTLTLTQGDDYTSAGTGRVLEWTSDAWSLELEAEVTAAFKPRLGGDRLTFTLEVVDSTTVRLELSSEETEMLSIGEDVYEFGIFVTTPRQTLVKGWVTVVEDGA